MAIGLENEKIYTTLSVSNSLNYVTKFNLNFSQVVMQCGYNPRNKMRWVILKNNSGEILLSQTFLKANRIVNLNFNSELDNFKGEVSLVPIESNKEYTEEFDYRNWANDFFLVFSGYTYEIVEEMDRNLRNVLVR